MANNKNWVHTLDVRTSRLGRRGEIRRREAFGWDLKSYQDGSQEKFDGFESGTYKPQYKTEKWSDIHLERAECDFISYRAVTLAESIYRLCYFLRRLGTVMVLFGLVILFVVTIATDGGEFADTCATIYGFVWLFFILSIIANIVSYFVGKSTVDKNRR